MTCTEGSCDPPAHLRGIGESQDKGMIELGQVDGEERLAAGLAGEDGAEGTKGFCPPFFVAQEKFRIPGLGRGEIRGGGDGGRVGQVR